LNDEAYKTISEDEIKEIEFSDIWKTHSILFNNIKKIINKGLLLAEETIT
jgi:hypothetical protein